MSSEIDKSVEINTDSPLELSLKLNSNISISSQNGEHREEVNTASENSECDNDTLDDNSTNLLNSNLNADTSLENLENNRRNMFYNYSKELMYIALALVLTTYATLNKNLPKFERSPSPKLLFTDEYLVKDWAGGNIEALQDKLATTELSLVLFYAPWCAHSESLKEPYEAVARTYYREVFFSAVNCWQPGGECRFKHSKIQSWPFIMAYHTNFPGIQYHGMWTERALSRFVRGLLRPIQRITTREELKQLIIENDAVIVGYFKANMLRDYYNKYFQMAVEWLEHDPYQEVKFVAVVGDSVNNFYASKYPCITMYRWNDSIEYKREESNWTSTDLHSFIVKRLNTYTTWVNPNDYKSGVLSTYLNKKPSLLFFTPRDLYIDIKDAYLMLKLISLRYYNCRKEPISDILTTDDVVNRRNFHRKRIEDLAKTCKGVLDFKKSNMICNDKHTDHTLKYLGIVNSSKYQDGSKDSFCLEKFVGENTAGRGTCDAETPHTNKVWSTAEVKEFHTENLCRQFNRIKNNIDSYFFPIDDHDINDIEGLSCKQNRTLAFVMLDSIYFETFVKNLDLRTNLTSKESAVIIVDNQSDSVYELKRNISTKSLTSFIKEFHSGRLKRRLRIKRNTEKIKKDQSRVSVRELNARQFQEYIEKNNNTKVVLFYSSHCALCSIVSQTMLTLAILLKDANIDFIRVDGETNDLLWQYTMENYPTLMIFPRNRPDETRVFPNAIEPNVSSVLGFILTNLNPIDRVLAIAEGCSRIKNCPLVLRQNLLNMISSNLKAWSEDYTPRDNILTRLAFLNRLYYLAFSNNLSRIKKEIIELSIV